LANFKAHKAQQGEHEYGASDACADSSAESTINDDEAGRELTEEVKRCDDLTQKRGSSA